MHRTDYVISLVKSTGNKTFWYILGNVFKWQDSGRCLQITFIAHA